MFDIFSLRLLNLPIIENYYVLEKKNHVLFKNGIRKLVISLIQSLPEWFPINQE